MVLHEEPEVDTSGDLPLWFFTYSDVITLLMTFFILLLTFATSEPEDYEVVRMSSSGTVGSEGLVRSNKRSGQRDSLIYRMRPLAGRITNRGSQMPPMLDDPALSTLSQGLTSIDEKLQHSLAESYTIHGRLEWFLEDENRLSSSGKQWLKMIGQQLQRLPFELVLQVRSADELRGIYTLARHLIDHFGVEAGRISIGILSGMPVKRESLRITMQRVRVAPDLSEVAEKDPNGTSPKADR